MSEDFVRTVHVPLGERSYDIVIAPLDGAAARAAWDQYAAGRTCLAVSDGAVQALYGDFRGLDGIALEPGERNKTLATVGAICSECVSRGLDRTSFLAARGGGVTGDLTGFAAAVYMRGIDFVQIPTTLLAMVDSSVGGKTGADLPEGKNLIGAFHQPRLVLIDPAFLRTLPDAEIRCGLAEIVKYGVILDDAFFASLEADAPAIARRDEAVFARIVEHSCRLKAQVVADDETERGVRAILNYGHTFGHAVELLSDFAVSHGEGVAVGMAAAGRLACELGRWSEAECRRQNALLELFGLPTVLDKSFAPRAVLEAMRRDKKSVSGHLHLVLPRAIGSVEVVCDVPEEKILHALEMCAREGR